MEKTMKEKVLDVKLENSLCPTVPIIKLYNLESIK